MSFLLDSPPADHPGWRELAGAVFRPDPYPWDDRVVADWRAKSARWLRAAVPPAADALGLIPEAAIVDPSAASPEVILAGRLFATRARARLAELRPPPPAAGPPAPAADAPPPDPYAELLAFADERLRGDQLSLVRLLCGRGGRAGLGDVLVATGASSGPPSAADIRRYGDSLNSLKKRANQKLRQRGWEVVKRDGEFRLAPAAAAGGPGPGP